MSGSNSASVCLFALDSEEGSTVIREGVIHCCEHGCISPLALVLKTRLFLLVPKEALPCRPGHEQAVIVSPAWCTTAKCDADDLSILHIHIAPRMALGESRNLS